MRRRAWIVGAVLAFAGALGWLWPKEGGPGRRMGPESKASARVEGNGAFSRAAGSGPTSGAEAAPREGLIRGVVVSFTGEPVRGASILALPHVEEDTLTQRACALATGDGSAAAPDICGWDTRRNQVVIHRMARPLECDLCGLDTPRTLEVLAEARAQEPASVRATTDERGAFELSGLDDGTHELWVEAPHGVAVLKAATGTEDLRVILEEGFLFQARVVDGRGEWLAGARVTVFPFSFVRHFECVTGADGRCSLGRVPELEYLQWGHQDGLVPDVERARGEFAEVTPLRLVRPREVAGVVVRRGQGVAGARVHVSTRRWDAWTTTQAQGAFAFTGMPLGPYSLEAFSEGDVATALTTRQTTEAEAKRLVLELRRCAVVEGQVLAESGTPVSGAQVRFSTLEAIQYERTVRTDARGRYRLDCALPGAFRLTVGAEGLLEREVFAREEQALAPGETRRLDWTLAASSLLAGEVVDGEGRGIAEARVDVHRERPKDEPGLPLLWTVLSDTAGRFHVDGLAPGLYEVEVTGPGGVGSHEGQARAPDAGLRFVLDVGGPLDGAIIGTVVDEEERPLEDVYVSASGPQGQEFAARTTGAGQFRLSKLLAGRWRLTAFHSGGYYDAQIRSIAEVELRGPEPAVVRLRLGAGLSVAGRVVDERGRPLEGARVVATRESPGEEQGVRADMAMTDAEGRFTLRYLEQGGFLLKADPPERELREVRASDELEGAVRSPGARRTLRSTTRLVRAGDTDVRMVLSPMHEVRGRVVLADGTPVPRFTVNSRPFADAQGRFSVARAPPGRFGFVIGAEGLSPALRVLKVDLDADATLPDVILEPGRRVRGQVLDAVTGERIPEAAVSLFDPATVRGADIEEEGELSWGWTESDGVFDIPHLSVGTLLLFECAGYRPESLRVPDGAGDLVVRLVPEPGQRAP